MKYLVLICLLVSGLAGSQLAVAKQKPKREKALAKALAADEVDNGVNFGLSVKHDGTAKYTSSGSIKTIQIFPLNEAAGVLTYDFS